MNWKALSLMLVVLLAGGVGVQVKAQEIDDETLKAYAQMEYDVEAFKEKKTAELVELKTDVAKTKFGSVARYNDIKKAFGDDEKLQALNVTDAEKVAFEALKSQEGEIIQSIKDFKIDKIKGEGGLGAGNYNKVRKAMKADAQVKEKYNSFYEEIKSQAEAAQEAATGSE